MGSRNAVRSILFAASILLALAGSAHAIKITGFIDTDTFLQRAKDIVIADVKAIPENPLAFEDGLYPADIEIVAVLKGDKVKGKTKLATIYPVEPGKRYMFASLGGSAFGTDLLAVPELAVISVSGKFDLKSLEDKSLKEQVSMIFQRRLGEVKAAEKQLEHERGLLEKTVSVPPQGANDKLNAAEPIAAGGNRPQFVVPGAVPIKFDQEVRIDVQSKPMKVKNTNLHILSIGTATFHLDANSRLTAKLKAGVIQQTKVDYWIYAAAFDARGRLLGTASHKEPVEFISLGRVLMAFRDIDLDFGISKDFSRAAYVVVTISNPDLPAQ